MARYRGPRLKKCRTVGTALPGLTTAPTLNRPFPPGEHGTKRRSKPSDYKIRLVEKQKARWHYGILEAQFQRYVREASRMRGASGQNLVFLLESRLDSLVWRLGLARTITHARQLVVHGHILVDGGRVDRPSFHVRAGSGIAVRERSRAKPFVAKNPRAVRYVAQAVLARVRPGEGRGQAADAARAVGPPVRAQRECHHRVLQPEAVAIDGSGRSGHGRTNATVDPPDPPSMVGAAGLVGCRQPELPPKPPGTSPSTGDTGTAPDVLPPVPPNIVYIYSDEHRAPILGCYGHPVVQTPNLDALAAESILFPNMFTNAPLCRPARATMMTGRCRTSTGAGTTSSSRARSARATSVGCATKRATTPR